MVIYALAVWPMYDLNSDQDLSGAYYEKIHLLVDLLIAKSGLVNCCIQQGNGKL
jgi:hypothetical protein